MQTMGPQVHPHRKTVPVPVASPSRLTPAERLCSGGVHSLSERSAALGVLIAGGRAARRHSGVKQSREIDDDARILVRTEGSGHTACDASGEVEMTAAHF